MDDHDADDNPFAGLSRYPPDPDVFDEPDWFDSTCDLLFQNCLKIGLCSGFLASSATMVAGLPLLFGVFGWLCATWFVALSLATVVFGHSIWRR